MNDLKKRGRPPRIGQLASEEYVEARCTHHEKELWTKAARAKHLALSEATRVALTGWSKDVLAQGDGDGNPGIKTANPTSTEVKTAPPSGVHRRITEARFERLRRWRSRKEEDGAAALGSVHLVRAKELSSFDDALAEVVRMGFDPEQVTEVMDALRIEPAATPEMTQVKIVFSTARILRESLGQRPLLRR